MREQLVEAVEDEVCPDLGPMNMEKEYRPSNQDALREYEVSLRFLSKGMIIRVGCKEIAFSTVAEGIGELNQYVQNTYEEQQKWHKILNK